MQQNFPLKNICTFKIGGPAKYFTEVASLKEVQEAFLFANEKQLPVFVLGKGSNCLFSDRGYKGLVVLNKMDGCYFEEMKVTVDSGYSFARLGTRCSKKGWTGLEFASGIPATVGGAIYMNAGANGQETRDTLKRVVYLHRNGQIQEYQKEEIDFHYRYSSFQRMQGYILQAVFVLEENPDSRKNQIRLLKKRIDTQPYQEMNAGCVFRNPENGSAGQHIDECGLKGLQVGGARVSTLHANFIVNTGDATSKDVLALIEKIQEKVRQKTQTDLELEVRYIPYE